ncbi:response regulator transcription factor [Pseudomonas mosselii]|uniref:response regulator transcription factor n=1 Tax=Pseudomonas mosselii TaxID=78327 RepID=UPI0007702F8D|nr:response regulator transcription factor [Pseudomonas mosselii]AMK29974.1 DNA-binding response regulator [Pseudomonas putida]ATB64182.1 DNA-binding response regulator [Pseudomonas mosselii]MBC3451254.1 response regulator transcription factor [Pseudomonas mosselii]MDH1099594.1 response regulator transcription factor [Pseudomonas mosselii]MDH1657565.1 response regulator transcription factor [Pseudomonas mosselii]
MYKVLVVDDHPFIRTSVCMQLRLDNLEVVGQADNGIDAVVLARERKPDVVILDLLLPGLDGLEVISRIRMMGSPVKVVVLTSQLTENFSLRCMKAGASGFVSKTEDLKILSKAVMAVLAGYTYFPEVALSSVNRRELEVDEAQVLASLTNRELIILQHLARGLSNKAIGEAMLLSNKTISTYKARLIEKLKVGSVIDMADIARRNGLI